MAQNQNKTALIFFWILSISLITFSISTFSQSFLSIASLVAGIVLVPPITSMLLRIFQYKQAAVAISVTALAFAIFGLTFNQSTQNSGSVLGVNEVRGEITNEVSIPESGQVQQTQIINPSQVDVNKTPAVEVIPEQTIQNPVQRIRVTSPAPDKTVSQPVVIADPQIPAQITNLVEGTPTKSNLPTFSGSGRSGDSVEVSDRDGNKLCTAIVGGDKTWTCNSSVLLNPGNNTFRPTTTYKDGGNATGKLVTTCVSYCGGSNVKPQQ
jgi:membrane protein implicated in regulation of membrane protease activity